MQETFIDKNYKIIKNYFQTNWKLFCLSLFTVFTTTTTKYRLEDYGITEEKATQITRKGIILQTNK